MLHVFFGTDTVRVREASQSYIDAQTQNKMCSTRIDTDTYETGIVRDLAGSESLFRESQVVVLDTLKGAEGAFVEVLEVLPQLKESRDIYVLVEGALTASEKKTCSTYAEVSEEFTKKKEELDVFALANALCARDKKHLWLLQTKFARDGVPYEEIIGILMWQLKLLRLAEKTRNAEEAGQKDFPYNKAKRALSKFKSGEVDTLAHSLIRVYHDGHTGRGDIGLGLEKWVLSL